jgi:hypothetical protein
MEGVVERKRDSGGKRSSLVDLGFVAILNIGIGWQLSMARTLSLLAHLPRLEADGVMHRRDCECVRCDAGFRPSEQERAVGKRRWEARRASATAAHALDRRQERARLRAAAVGLQLELEARQVDDRIAALHAARARVDGDRRLARFQALRRSGLPLSEALAEVDRWAQQGSNLRPTD